MRKILAGFMATAMVTSICATASMAATTVPAANSSVIVDLSKVTLETKNQVQGFEINLSKLETNGVTSGGTAGTFATNPEITVTMKNGAEVVLAASGKAGFTGATMPKDLAADLSVSSATGNYPKGTAIATDGSDFTVTAKDAKVTIAVKESIGAGSDYKLDVASVVIDQTAAAAGANETFKDATDKQPTYSIIDTKDFDKTEALKEDAVMTLPVKDGAITLTVDKANIKAGMTSSEIAKAFAVGRIALTGTPRYKGDSTIAANELSAKAEGSNVIVSTNKTGVDFAIVLSGGVTVTPAGKVDHGLQFDGVATTSTIDASVDPTVDASGNLAASLRDIIYCDKEGNPIPLVDSATGIDNALNDQDGVQSNNSVYFLILDGGRKYDNEDYWKLKLTKGDNGKYVEAISDVSKVFSNDLYNVWNRAERVTGTGGARHRYIKVELKEDMTDSEYKISIDMRLSPKSKAVDVFGVPEDSELKIKDFSFYMKNITRTADNDWLVGINGLMLDPLPNDWNEVTYYDEDGDVAFMRFFGDSDVGKFYAKLSTKWAHEDYAAYFNDQDAFYFEFTGSPKLSSTSRADLQIYNPFINEDGEETIDPTTATIYQVVDGDLIDVTDSFTYEEGENGDNAFVTRTRFLGSYIICEKPVEEAAGESDIDDLMPDDMETPDDVTPDNNGGGKAPANTGRYL